MTPERYNRVFDIFLGACERASSEWPDYLDHACASDPSLRAEVEALLDLDIPEEEPAAVETRVAGAALRPGFMVGARYCIDGRLGEGGMGVVYRATDLETNRDVAIKVVTCDAAGGHVIDSLSREARAISRLAHPNIVRILAWQEASEIGPYLVTELVDGPTLSQEIARRRRLDVPEVLSVAAQVCSGVQAAHDAGVIHRDLKPQNVILEARDSGWHARILDFGLAKLVHPTTLDRGLRSLSGALLGSPYFMSPEQCQGLSLDARSDVYSIGCLLYAALTGRPPFAGESVAFVLIRHLDEPPVAPGLLEPGISPELDAAILRALEKSPARRFQSARDLGDALADLAT